MSRNQNNRLTKEIIVFLLVAFAATGSAATGRNANQPEKRLWDPVFVFQIQWILNVGLPEARLTLKPAPIKQLEIRHESRE
jgi:hypothetical protein